MLSFDEARARILAAAVPTRTERVGFDASPGRVLAEDVIARVALPPFDYSAMDGYALRAADAAQALRVVGESKAGSVPPPLTPQTAMRIFTGAPLPAGADTIAPQEDVDRTAESIVLTRMASRGQHVRSAGEDLRAGAVALPRGTRLGPNHLALLATLDQVEVQVASPPRVIVLATGDELRDPGTPARAGSVVDCNAPMLVALCRRLGAVVEARRAPDDLSSIRAAIRGALETADVLLTIGGVSVGDHDHVRDALAAEGVPLDFWKVAIKPGKPLAFGERGAQRVLGLPGNPAAAFVTFNIFVAPLLRAMQGDLRPLPRSAPLRLVRAAKAAGARLEFARARLVGEDRVEVLANQASGAVTSIAWAEAIVALPPGIAFAEGDVVECWPLETF